MYVIKCWCTHFWSSIFTKHNFFCNWNLFLGTHPVLYLNTISVEFSTHHIVTKPIYCIVNKLWSSHIACGMILRVWLRIAETEKNVYQLMWILIRKRIRSKRLNTRNEEWVRDFSAFLNHTIPFANKMHIDCFQNIYNAYVAHECKRLVNKENTQIKKITDLNSKSTNRSNNLNRYKGLIYWNETKRTQEFWNKLKLRLFFVMKFNFQNFLSFFHRFSDLYW